MKQFSITKMQEKKEIYGSKMVESFSCTHVMRSFLACNVDIGFQFVQCLTNMTQMLNPFHFKTIVQLGFRVS